MGENVPEQLKLDLGVEMEALDRLNKAIALAVEVGDNATRDLLESILKSEEEHVDWLEAQRTLIAQVGVENYLSQQIRG